MQLRCEKWHGLGNDFIVVAQNDLPARDDADGDGYELAASLVEALCDRHFGVGADGVLVVGRSDVANIRMRIHNADGSMAEMCGNGIRVVARYARDRGLVELDDDGGCTIETAGGIMRPRIEADDVVRVDMGVLRSAGIDTVELGDMQVTGRRVDAGNPHFVVHRAVAGDGLRDVGPRVETHDAFPHRTNVEFYEVLEVPTPLASEATPLAHVRMRVWERGVGETLACGTGACAVAFTAARDHQLRSPITVTLPGGDLTVEIDDDGRTFMTGPATFVFSATIDTDALQAAQPDATSTTTHRAGTIVPA